MEVIAEPPVLPSVIVHCAMPAAVDFNTTLDGADGFVAGITTAEAVDVVDSPVPVKLFTVNV